MNVHGNLIIELYLWNSEGGWGGAKQARGCDMQTPGREGGEILPWGFWALGKRSYPCFSEMGSVLLPLCLLVCLSVKAAV